MSSCSCSIIIASFTFASILLAFALMSVVSVLLSRFQKFKRDEFTLFAFAFVLVLAFVS